MAGMGVGELALLGAAIGGTGAAATGNDPLKGALLGALGGAGGAGLGLFGGAAGAGAAGAAGTAAAETAAITGGAEAAGATSALGSASALPSGSSLYSLTSAPGAAAGFGSAAPAGGIAELAGASQAANPMYALSSAPNAAMGFGSAAPTGAGQIVGGSGFGIPGMSAKAATDISTAAAAKGAAAAPTLLSDPVAWYKGLPTMGKLGIAAAPAGIAMLTERRSMPEEEEYDGPLSRFRYDPDRYIPFRAASGGVADLTMARGGPSHLGDYSDGSRLLKGPGDGMSDDIPATIAGKRPARLADGEFVVPADVVSHLGNGSTDAGAKHLYAMMDRVRSARTGNKRQGRQIKPQKFIPA